MSARTAVAPRPLVDELSRPLSPAEEALGGCAPAARARGRYLVAPTGQSCAECAGSGWRQPGDKRQCARLCYRCKGTGHELPDAAQQRRARERRAL